MFDDIGRNFLMNPQNGLKVGGQCRHPPLLPVCKAQLTVLRLSVSVYVRVCARAH